MRDIKHIAIAAPGRKVIPEQVEYAIKWLHSKGMNAVFDERLFASDYIFAGTAELRAQVIQEYLDRDDIDAIWFARGGYGSIHIIDKIDFLKALHRICDFLGDHTILSGTYDK